MDPKFKTSSTVDVSFIDALGNEMVVHAALESDLTADEHTPSVNIESKQSEIIRASAKAFRDAFGHKGAEK